MADGQSKLVTKVLKAFGAVGEFLKPILIMFLSKAGSSLAAIALTVVADIAADKTNITNDDKRKAAFDKIKEQLISQGISVGTSVINTAIEIALQKIKQVENSG